VENDKEKIRCSSFLGRGQKKVWVSLFTALVVIAIAAVAVIFLIGRGSSDTNPGSQDGYFPESDNEQEDETSLYGRTLQARTNRMNSVLEYILNGEADKAIAMYQVYIRSTLNYSLKADMYLEIAGLLYAENELYGRQHDEVIIRYAHKAEELNASTASAEYITLYERELGNQSTANHYEQIFKERLKKEIESYEDEDGEGI
jgi:flagellar basal body-associated protein FliL